MALTFRLVLHSRCFTWKSTRHLSAIQVCLQVVFAGRSFISIKMIQTPETPENEQNILEALQSIECNPMEITKIASKLKMKPAKLKSSFRRGCAHWFAFDQLIAILYIIQNTLKTLLLPRSNASTANRTSVAICSKPTTCWTICRTVWDRIRTAASSMWLSCWRPLPIRKRIRHRVCSMASIWSEFYSFTVDVSLIAYAITGKFTRRWRRCRWAIRLVIWTKSASGFSSSVTAYVAIDILCSAEQ